MSVIKTTTQKECRSFFNKDNECTCTYSTHARCAICEQLSEVHIFGGYANGGNLYLCKFHATQLARILLEDICDIEGDRHG